MKPAWLAVFPVDKLIWHLREGSFLHLTPRKSHDTHEWPANLQVQETNRNEKRLLRLCYNVIHLDSDFYRATDFYWADY